MDICPINGYQVCRVPVTIRKSYKVEVLCIVDDIDECHILLGRPWRLDVKRKSIEDKVRREKVFEDWSSLKILTEVRNIKVVDAFQEEDELEYAEPLDREAKQVTYIVQRVLCSPKHYNELVTYDVIDIEACHVLLGIPWQHDVDSTHQGKSNMYVFKWSGKTIATLPLGFVSFKNKLKSKTLVTLVASPKDFQAERKETRVSHALVMKGVNDVMKNAIPMVIKPLLAEFGKIVTDDTLDALPPLRNIQHQIDFK
ncbi:hypothetical protein Tco_1339158 [Tanacetum coccineum]